MRRTFTFGGKTYNVTDLKMRQWAEILRWAQDQYLDATKRNLAGLSAEQASAMLAAASDVAGRMTTDSPQFMDLLRTPDGMQHFVRARLHRHHPDLKQRELDTIFADPAALRAATK